MAGRRQASARGAAALLTSGWLSGCAVAPDPAGLDFDPFDDWNRPVHELNKDFDAAAFGPAARAYGTAVPDVARAGASNVVDHLSLPRVTIQYALQGRPLRVAESSLRFAVNTVFGLGGLLDPAAEMGLPYRDTNFDETFYVWGLPEGGYLVLPLIGPGTERDWTGYALDQVADPLFYLTSGVATQATIALRGLDILNDRYALDTALEALLYESQDSYTALRIAYLQNMRARLQGGTDIEQLEDVYGDF